MSIKFTIDGKECTAKEGQTIVEAAKDNGIYIPTLCNFEGVKPKASCRICTVMINGRPATACTMKVAADMKVEAKTAELEDFRKAVVELMFTEGNHMCPTCEKSGNCELQALGYKYTMLAPRFPYIFPVRDIDAKHPKLLKDHNRCILCKRCIRALQTEDGKALFAFGKRGAKAVINIDMETTKNMSDELAQKCMDICPVGAILRKEVGFKDPIGTRKYDTQPIGSDIEG